MTAIQSNEVRYNASHGVNRRADGGVSEWGGDWGGGGIVQVASSNHQEGPTVRRRVFSNAADALADAAPPSPMRPQGISEDAARALQGEVGGEFSARRRSVVAKTQRLLVKFSDSDV